MQFGLSLPHFRPVASPEAIRLVAQRAEQLDYDGIWVSDHIVIPASAAGRFGSTFYEPLTVLGFAAACTSRVRLGTTVIILPYRNPVVAAKVLSTLDVLSGGRVTAGMAVGWTEDEFKALGVPFQERGALSDEYIAAFKALWTQETPAFHGHHVHFEDIAFEPKPVQKPHIPIWIGGNSKRAIRRAVALGDGWHPTRPLPEDIKAGVTYLHEVCGQRGRDPRSLTIAAREPLKFYDGTEAAMRRRPLLGSTQKVIDDIGRYRDAGVHYLMLDTFYSAPELEHETLESLLETIERFAADVMPKIQS
ncbi:MAG TPA: LLM class F420-dependent oxidoreductase [Candidatus Tectomicrobia bacterium]|jgi:probable F420-dependent oxidoreductase|nr:LLM class F420-dependent oxidoreductase [Candidatus Tectomicrobia bacterium]